MFQGQERARGRRCGRERVGAGLEVAGLAIPVHEPHDAGLEPKVGVRAAAIRRLPVPPGSLAGELHAREECSPGGFDGLGIVAPPAEHLVRKFAVLAEHQGSSVCRPRGRRLSILIVRAACRARTQRQRHLTSIIAPRNKDSFSDIVGTFACGSR